MTVCLYLFLLSCFDNKPHLLLITTIRTALCYNRALTTTTSSYYFLFISLAGGDQFITCLKKVIHHTFKLVSQDNSTVKRHCFINWQTETIYMKYQKRKIYLPCWFDFPTMQNVTVRGFLHGHLSLNYEIIFSSKSKIVLVPDIFDVVCTFMTCQQCTEHKSLTNVR